MNNDIPYEEKYLKTSLLFQKDDNNTTLFNEKGKKIANFGGWRVTTNISSVQRRAVRCMASCLQFFCINLFFLKRLLLVSDDTCNWLS